jgi:hypothetical protein
MIPRWKIKRELERIGAQIRNLPTAIVDLYELTQEPKLRRAHYAKLHERIAVTDGHAQETDRIAVLLIYQPAGLAESTFVLCQDLINNGFSPFVVTNSPLSDTDSTKLNACCWKLMTRPNFGYDFGGYQDALLALRQIKTDLEYLIVMNDSVWLEFTPDIWARLSEIDADVVGLIQEDKIFSTQTSEKHVEYRNIQSYFYVFMRGAWTSHWFWKFWTNYKMTSNKKRTIKRGEIGFSKFLFLYDVKLKALISRNNFIEKIQNCDVDTIHNMLTFSAYGGKCLEQEKFELLSSADGSETWRLKALRHIESSLMREPLNATYWVSVCKVFDINLIKKNKQHLYCRMRRAYDDAHKAGFAKPLRPVTASELTKSVVAERAFIDDGR